MPAEKIYQELQKRLGLIKDLEKQLASQKINIARDSLDSLIQNAEIINNIKVISGIIDGSDMDLLRKTVDLIKQKTNNSVIALGSTTQSKALLVMGVTDLIPRGLDASKIIRDIASLIGGSGGGRSNFAQAGGNQPENFKKAFERLKNTIAQMK